MILQQRLNLLHEMPLVELLHLGAFLLGRRGHLRNLLLAVSDVLRETAVLLPFESLQELDEHDLSHLLLKDLK